MAARPPAFTVSGPGVDRCYPSGGVALSAAITYAARAWAEVTYYVRTPSGEPYGYAEADEDGNVFVRRHGPAR